MVSLFRTDGFHFSGIAVSPRRNIHITDYLVLIIYILKALKVTKTEMKRIVNNFQEITDELRNKIPTNVYNRIVYTDYTNKLVQLRKFISK